jgi:cytochrome-b5 reductase
MSGHIHGLKVGDTLSIKGPTVKFEYRPNEVNEIGMVAGGTGIAPMIQVIQRILSNSNDKTKVSLLFANVTEEDILLRKYLEKIVEKNPQQFKVHFVLDKPPKDWTQGSGFINETMLKTYMPAPGQGKVFVCGPPPMMNHGIEMKFI